MLKFIVVGTRRCGTASTAQVFNRIGIACGHGWVYTHDGERRYPQFEIVGDATPLAVPSAHDFAGLVLHQVRHPLAVIASLAGTGDRLDDAMRHYVEWNLRCERHNGYLRYRIEELEARLLVKFADLIGHAVDEADAARALAAVPDDFNTRHGTRGLDWSDLPEGPARDSLVRLATRYGYRMSDSCRRHARDLTPVTNHAT